MAAFHQASFFYVITIRRVAYLILLLETRNPHFSLKLLFSTCWNLARLKAQRCRRTVQLLESRLARIKPQRCRMTDSVCACPFLESHSCLAITSRMTIWPLFENVEKQHLCFLRIDAIISLPDPQLLHFHLSPPLPPPPTTTFSLSL
jgi:hypothetical protein